MNSKAAAVAKNQGNGHHTVYSKNEDNNKKAAAEHELANGLQKEIAKHHVLAK